MTSLLASILALLLIVASIGAGAHAGGLDASAMADHHATVAVDGEVARADCCDAAGHEMSGSCFLPIGVARAGSCAVRPRLATDVLPPASASFFAATEPGAPGKPPRTA